jgi:hypothetical protein
MRRYSGAGNFGSGDMKIRKGAEEMTYSYMHLRDANYYAGAVLVDGAVKEIRASSWGEFVNKMAQHGVELGEKK